MQIATIMFIHNQTNYMKKHTGEKIERWLLSMLFITVTGAGRLYAQQTPDPILKGAIDTHIHTEEEYAILEEGSMDIIQLAHRAQ